jgi:hypothetical protein
MDSDLLTAGGLWFADSFRKMFYLMTPAELVSGSVCVCVCV